MTAILVLGSSGQVASHLRERLPDATFWGRASLDMMDTARLEQQVLALAPTVIINAAAYTAVDAAESDAAAAWRLNAEAPAALARAAQTLGAVLVHLSTDYAFDGEATEPYPASAPTSPINVYGRTKVAGEHAVASLCQRYWILRTSWVFSEYGGNFVKTMLRVGAERDTLRVVSDQFGRPTYAGHIASVAAALADPETGSRLPWGTYHAVGGPVVSWFEFARHIFERAVHHQRLQTQPSVEAIPTADYPTPAVRPLRAVLEPSIALHEATGCTLHWPDGLEQALGNGA